MRSSIRDVAIRAGVSNATVSRVLNNTDVKISPETRQRVHRIAAEMGYHPNRAARSLVTGRTQSVALCVATLLSEHTARTVSVVLLETLGRRYDLLVSEMYGVKDGTTDTAKLCSLPVDALIVLDLPPSGELNGLKNSLLQGKPVVNFGAYVTPAADYVQVELQESSKSAVRHLYEQGCRRIGYVVPHWIDWYSEHGDARLRGYQTAMAELGIEPIFLPAPATTREGGVQAIDSYLEQHHACPDGLYCFNDELGIGTLRALADRRIRVPDDVAVISCDGIEETAYQNPRLSTIRMPMTEMCAQAWEYLDRRMNDPDLPLQQIVISPQLEIRDSSLRKKPSP